MFRLEVESYFDAAHYIRTYIGKCSRMHGHRWGIKVVIEGKILDNNNILVDFSRLKSALSSYLDIHFDHQVLNETLGEQNMTAEWLSRHIYNDISNQMPVFFGASDVRLVYVEIKESPTCAIKFYRPMP